MYFSIKWRHPNNNPEMNFNIIFALAASIFGLVVAEVHRQPNDCRAKKCTRELEAIVYQPATYYREYLDRISQEIKIQGPYILFTNQADSFIEAFEAKYQVQVNLINPFRRDPNLKGAFVPTFYSTTSVANMNGTGYDYSTEEGMKAAMVEFIVYSPDGRLVYVMINLPLESKSG